MGNGFDQLCLGYAVFEGVAQVEAQLLGVSARGEHSDGDEAAIARAILRSIYAARQLPRRWFGGAVEGLHPAEEGEL